MSEDLEGEELANSLKQLIINMGPYIREAGSVEQAQNTLTHLEEVDSKFHKYDFVRRLKAKMEAKLGGLVEEEIQKHSIAPNDTISGHETLVSKITNMVLNSREYHEMTHELHCNINLACDRLMMNFEEEFHEITPNKNYDSGRSRRSFFSEDFESSLGDNSLNQSTIMFMSQDQYQQIANLLDKNRTLQERRDAVKSLYQVPSLDVQNYEVWSDIRQGLVDALLDQDDQLWMLAFKYIARGFSQNNAHTKDVFSTLVDYLLKHLGSWKGQTARGRSNLDCHKPDITRVLKAVRLMNEFTQHITQYWVRFPERTVEEIIECTLKLLSFKPGPGSLAYTPIHYLALLDVKATWFIKWMHANYSRAPLLRQLHIHKSIVEDAVRCCVEFVSSRSLVTEPRSGGEAAGGGKRTSYSMAELDYVYFVHSTHLLGCLLCFRQGQAFFPVSLPDSLVPGEVQMTDLLVTLLQLVHEAGGYSSRSQQGSQLSPGSLVVGLFRRLCSTEVACRTCICVDKVTDALLRPLSQWLDAESAPDPGLGSTSEVTFLHIAEILASIASTTRGRQHLLYGESLARYTKSKSSPAYLIAEFAKKALNVDLPMTYSAPPSNTVIGSFVFVCRQLYSTCEGLLVLCQFDLQSCVADAWRIASREADNAATPTPSGPGDPPLSQKDSSETQYLVLWEDTLRDNLLNFAATPKGLLLLQQTGAINDCVQYMYSRYARKMQVSRCEKFGYGFMMTQVAATAPGIVALQSTGFIEALVKEVWGSIEVADDKPVYTPRPWPVYPIDKIARKPFTRLLNILSAFPAVYELLSNQPLPTKAKYDVRVIPDSIPGLLDRIVLLDSEEKMLSLYNWEQSHTFGLRVLSVMVSCLDTFLLLQSQYDFLAVLLKAQADNTHPDTKQIIVDMLSVERNYLLVKCYLMGGPSERILPTRALQEGSTPYPHALFSAYPVPREYVSNMASRSAMKQDNDLNKIVAEAKKAEPSGGWLERCRKAFCNLLRSRPELVKGGLLQDLLDCAVAQLAKVPDEAVFPVLDFAGTESALKAISLSPLQQLGVKHAIRYGTHLKLLGSSAESVERLSVLVKRCSCYLKQQQRKGSSVQLKWLQQQYVGFDWFTATVFLLMNGNLERSWKFIHQVSALTSSAYLWPARLHNSVLQPLSLMTSGIPALFTATGHNIELILQDELPHVYSAFRMCGYAPSQICQQWCRQCFWNVLDWPEVTHYVTTVLLLGCDYQVYLCIALLHFLQGSILLHMHQQDLIVFLKEEPIRGFRVGDHMEYMQGLQRKYRKTVLSDMSNFSKP